MLKSGMIIGDRYEILNKIGSGGMSIVYKGRDQKLNRNVAVKVLKSEYREDKNFVRKFREEAQAAACLAHPNIVNVYDVGNEQGIHYIVMELVEGITLKNYIERKGKLTIKEATSIAIQVSMGLEVAHNNDIVHRDIKPQNIMISKDGKVKVMDFGIAKAASSETIASNAMGSVHYTSPEQARGGYSDAKSDIYSLGIVMYEMVTGRVPFDGETTVAVAVKHLQEEMPSPKIFCPELPVSLEQIIYKCTEKSAAKRYANMTELITDLKQSLQTPDADFVKRNQVDEVAKTVTITKSDLDQIKKETGRIQYQTENENLFQEYHTEHPDISYEEDDYEENEDDEEFDDEEMDPRMEKIMTIGGIAVAIIILLMIILLVGKVFDFGLFSGNSSKNDKQDKKQEEQLQEDQVEMINVLGMTWEEAKEALNKKGLGITSAGSEESEEYEEGQIMKQSVAEGEMVEKNTTIEVTTAVKKVEMITVPEVVGELEEDAVYRLEKEGFVTDVTESFHDTVKAGKVVRISPDEGTEQVKGSTIFVTVSKGPEKKEASVPSVVNTTRENAELALKNAGLTVGSVKEDYSDTVAQGNVCKQSIDADKVVEEGTSVDLVISKGPEKLTMPNLWGNPKDRAIEKLHALGLSVEVYEAYSDAAEGRVFKTEPEADAAVERDSIVKIYLSKGPAPEPSETTPSDTTGSDQNTNSGETSETTAADSGNDQSETGTN